MHLQALFRVQSPLCGCLASRSLEQADVLAEQAHAAADDVHEANLCLGQLLSAEPQRERSPQEGSGVRACAARSATPAFSAWISASGRRPAERSSAAAASKGQQRRQKTGEDRR